MSSQPTVAAERKIHWKWLAVILGVGGALIGFWQVAPWFDNAIPTIASIAAGLLTATGVVLWILLGTGMSPQARRRGWVVVALCVTAFLATTRIKYRGDLQMALTPQRWVLNLLKRVGYDVGDVIHTAAVASTALVIEPTPTDSPQFLGPHGDPIAVLPPGTKLARDWSKRPPREIWRKPIGDGWSSFAVVGRYAFTQEETTDLEFEQVTCYDLENGELRWVHADPGVYKSSFGGIGPRATPTYFAGKVVTIGAQGLLNCLDAATGKLIWSRNPMTESQATIPDWGVSSSPLVFHSDKLSDVVVMSAGGTAGNSLHAYRLSDGAELWSVGNDPPGYCSPELRKLGGVEQIVLVNWQSVTGHDPDTGAELWRYDEWQGGQPKVPQPVVLDDRRVLISAGYGTGCVLLDVVRSADGKWTATPQWKSTKLKPKFTNLVVRDGHAYGLDDGEFLICLDLADGKLKWRSKRGTNYGHGQVLLVGDLLLVQTETGDVALVAADPNEFNELTRFTALPRGVSWNSPVVAGNKLLVRNDEEAACFELPTE